MFGGCNINDSVYNKQVSVELYHVFQTTYISRTSILLEI